MLGGERTAPSSKERRLVRDAKRGSREAAEQIVRQNWDDLYRIAYLIIRDPAAAEDIAQEAILAGLRGLRRFDGERPLRPWLAAIATNRALDCARKRARRPEAAIGTLAEVSVEVDQHPDTGVPDLRRALEALDPETRAMLVLRYVLDYRAAEIADALGIPAATVRTRLARALAQIRTDLSEEDE
jgi:RNA polymerase sigma-70 factor (ECF subfamily)